jgi:protein tyrosine/serine phosphatase
MTIPSDKNSNFSRYVSVAMFLAIVTGAAFFWQVYANASVYHMAVVQPGVLYRSGALSVREWKTVITRIRPKTDVCLADEQEMNDPAKPKFKNEVAFLKEQGVNVIRIPVRLGGWPSNEDLQKFLNVAADPANQPVIVHCDQGVRRTAMMVAAYQESILGWDKNQAREQIITFGHSQSTIDDIRRFIDLYDPKTRTAPAELAAK